MTFGGDGKKVSETEAVSHTRTTAERSTEAAVEAETTSGTAIKSFTKASGVAAHILTESAVVTASSKVAN